jgi:hypothetical protein
MDIVERLRGLFSNSYGPDEIERAIDIVEDAADEIERLRKKIKRMEYYLPENIDFVRCGNGKDHFSFEIVYKALGEKK